MADDTSAPDLSEDAIHERWMTAAERYEAWREESRDRLFGEEKVKAWAEEVLRKVGLPTRLDSYVFLADGTFRAANTVEVEAFAKLGTRPCNLMELVGSLGASREANMAARALFLLGLLRFSLDSVTPKIHKQDRRQFEDIFQSIWDLSSIYTEMAMLREPDGTRKIREASRKLTRRTIDRAKWDQEFALAESLAAEGKSERQQAEIIVERMGGKKNAVRDRLRRQRGTARRGTKEKSGD